MQETFRLLAVKNDSFFNYQLRLVPEETSEDGVFRPMHAWLDKILDSNKLDASDALGAALCHLYQKSNNQTTKKSWKQYLISNPDKLV